MAVSMVDGCRASYTAERWLESAGRRCVYPEVICSTSLPEYCGLIPISTAECWRVWIDQGGGADLCGQ